MYVHFSARCPTSANATAWNCQSYNFFHFQLSKHFTLPVQFCIDRRCWCYYCYCSVVYIFWSTECIQLFTSTGRKWIESNVCINIKMMLLYNKYFVCSCQNWGGDCMLYACKIEWNGMACNDFYFCENMWFNFRIPKQCIKHTCLLHKFVFWLEKIEFMSSHLMLHKSYITNCAKEK